MLQTAFGILLTILASPPLLITSALRAARYSSSVSTATAGKAPSYDEGYKVNDVLEPG